MNLGFQINSLFFQNKSVLLSLSACYTQTIIASANLHKISEKRPIITALLRIKRVLMGKRHKKNTASLINEQHRKAYV